jgi:hypothetical protein
MISDAKEVIAQLNSPSDWALIGGAMTAGFILDGAINIVPLPFFSPGVCALAAGSIMLTLKRSVEASQSALRNRGKIGLLEREAVYCIETLRANGDDGKADDLAWDIAMNKGDTAALTAIVTQARIKARTPVPTNGRAQARGAMIFSPTPRNAGGGGIQKVDD